MGSHAHGCSLQALGANWQREVEVAQKASYDESLPRYEDHMWHRSNFTSDKPSSTPLEQNYQALSPNNRRIAKRGCYIALE